MPCTKVIAYVEEYLARARASAAAAAKKLKPRGRLPLVADRPAFYRAHRESGGRTARTAKIYCVLTDVALKPRQVREFVIRQKKGRSKRICLGLQFS